jgi:hypothetical protein
MPGDWAEYSVDLRTGGDGTMIYRFGDCELDTRRLGLRRQGEVQRSAFARVLEDAS